MRFLAGSEEGIASNILSSRLKHLTAHGLLTRADARRGQRAMYSLTEAGIQVPNPDSPRPSEQLQAAYNQAIDAP